ncbi:MAG: DNA-3-methyladenine glycosylase I [Bradymonadia bacterium]
MTHTPDQTPLPEGLVCGPDGLPRCKWGVSHPLYIDYHDHEWGRPEPEDVKLFEKICLEGFQSGLSWLTILKKRDNFRAAFHGFDIDQVAAFGEADVARLMSDTGIVRNRRKIEATIHNARMAQQMREAEGSLGAWFWRWAPPRREAPLDWSTLRSLGKTPESEAMSKALKKLGWRFVGPTTAYAFMQAMGLVNDHVAGCAFHAATEADAQAFQRP